MSPILIVLIAIIIIIVVPLILISIKKKLNARTPQNGINESTYLNVNGTKQWINIYGNDLNNPVLLYIHGGPGMSTSLFSYAITRKWADVYTVVTWDQRNCGKSYSQKMNDVELSNEIVMSDAMAIIDYLTDRLHKDKMTLLGHSWGSLLGARLVLDHPERFETFIGTGQLIDLKGNEEKLFKEIRIMAKDSEKDLALIDELEATTEPTARYFEIRTELLDKYGQNIDIKRSDLNIRLAVMCNPYYTSKELRRSEYMEDCKNKDNAYSRYISSKETNDYFSLKDVVDFPIPYYNINGDRDFIADYRTAQDFFDRLNAPAKKMYVLENTTHGTLLENSKGFSECIHDIAEQRR